LAKATLAPGESVNWLPPADAHGALEAFPVQVADALGQAERTVSVTILVSGVPDDPVLKWAKPDGIIYGTALGQVQLGAAANVPGVFEYRPALGSVLKAGNGQSLKAKFTPEDTAEYNVVEARVTIDVALAKPEVSWFKPGDIDAGTALSEVQLNATADVPGEFEYDPVAGTVIEVREGEVFSVFTLKVHFNPADESNYLPADREVEITVLPRAPENDAPSILVQPEGFDVVVGGAGQFSVSAVGLKPVLYQWYRNGTAIAGATKAVLKLESISLLDTGEYEVEVDATPVEIGSEEASQANRSQADRQVLPASYMLQTGAFEQRALADTEMRRLQTLGLNVVVKQQALIGSTLYLVQSGPYDDSRQLDAAEQVLRANNIASMRLSLQ